MAGISSMGIGSGIDIRSLVNQLLAAERQPVQTRLDRQETRLQAELSSFGTLKSALSDFSNVVAKLGDAASFRSASTSSGNPEVIDLTGSADVTAAASFGIQVVALAESQSVASGTFAGASAQVGGGSLTFRFGTVSTDEAGAVTGFAQNPNRATATVEVPAEAATLADVRDAVNAAGIGIRASIIDDGSGDRLVFVSEDTGAANGFLVDVADDDGNATDGAGLSALAFNEGAANLQQSRSGADAALVVDGLDVTRPGNSISDLLPGATLELKGTSAVPVEVRVEPDRSKASKLVKDFVTAYNELQKQIEAVAGYDAESQQGGVLQGNSLVRSVEWSVRRLMTQRLEALEGRSVRALADVGIKTTREGTLEIDQARLSAKLEEDLDGVAALFGTAGLVDGSGFAFESSESTTRAGSYAVQVTQLAEQALVTGAAVTAASAAAPVVIDADNDELELTVDGVASGRITLSQGSYTSGEALAAELQARINGAESLRDAGIAVTVEWDAAAATFAVRSNRYGSASAVEVTFADTNTAATYGFSVGQLDEGVDVAGSIGGVAAEGAGRYLTAQSGDTNGLKLEITASQPGNLGRVTFSRGIGALLERAIDAFLESDGPFSSATRSIKDKIDDIGDERMDLSDRLVRMEERLVAQFSAMDAMVAQLNQTSSFLTSQLSGLEALARNAGKSR